MEITTARAALHLNKIFEKNYILLDGKRIPINNDGNLLGTTRTLDRYDGDIMINEGTKLTLENGVCSRTGVAVIDDTKSLRLLKNGNLAPCSSDEFDLYIFAYGNEYRDAVKALYSITGKVPMLPRYAFGNWWSRYHQYSDEEYLYLLDEFQKRGIPMTVATLDMDWHYSTELDQQKKISESGKATADRGCLIEQGRNPLGWTGYSWNPELFPDYKAFLKALQKRDLKITLNLPPADGVRYFEDMYTEMATAMGIDPATEACVKFDIANNDFVNAYFEVLHHPYEKDGVDFWWIDWQQGTNSAMEGLDPLWALNHYHSLDIARDGKHPLIMSRYAGIGSHRYPIGFSGDTTISWNTLKLMPYFTATATNIGYTWWGHDIGGHHLGTKDDELYLRFLQFGVFNPINRMHSSSSEIITKEPWAYENGIGELAREMLILRHRMIPFLYSCNYRTHQFGIGLMEPMYYQYADYPESYLTPDQYLFGGDFIVAPITRHSEEKSLTSLDVWLPQGTWTDIFTGDVYRVGAGGKTVKMVRSLDSIPVLAREGATLVLSADSGNSIQNPLHLEAQIFNGNGDFTLFEDNGHGAQAFTLFRNTQKENTQTVSIEFSGDASVLPAHRDLTLTFKNIIVHTSADSLIDISKKASVKITVLKNGVPTAFEASKYATVSVTLSDIDYNAKYEITVAYDAYDVLTEAKRAAICKLQKVQAPYKLRNRVKKQICTENHLTSLANNILISDLDYLDKLRLVETMIENEGKNS